MPPTLRFTRTIHGPSSSLVLRWLHLHHRSHQPAASEGLEPALEPASHSAGPASPRKKAKMAGTEGSPRAAVGSVDGRHGGTQPRCVPFVVLLALQLEGCTEEMHSRRLHESVLEERIAQLDATLEELSSAREVARARTSRLREAYDGRIAEQELKIRELTLHRSNAVALAVALQKRVDDLRSSGADVSQEMTASLDAYSDRTQVYRAMLDDADAKLHELAAASANAADGRDDVRKQLESMTAKYKKEVGDVSRVDGRALVHKKSFRTPQGLQHAASSPGALPLQHANALSTTSASSVPPRLGGAAPPRISDGEPTAQQPPTPPHFSAPGPTEPQSPRKLRGPDLAGRATRGVTFAAGDAQRPVLAEQPRLESAGRPFSRSSLHGYSPTLFGGSLGESRGSTRSPWSGAATPSSVPSHVEQLWAGSSTAKLKAAIRAETQPCLLAYLYAQLAMKLRCEAGGARSVSPPKIEQVGPT